MKKASICVVIPAYNEELVIEPALKALKRVIRKEHIYVVSDGSSDKTAYLAKKHVSSVLALRKNVGKARALESLIKKYKLTDRYKYILFSDADSRLSPDFRKEITKYIPSQPACIIGTVTSDRHGFISAFRVYEYGMSHRVYKQAQNILGVITVAPGCTSLYRSDVLDQLDFSNHTLTEDFDITLQIHKKKLGAIVYAPRARVVTQDPPTLSDYWKQVLRWNTGFWQNIFLHKLYTPNKAVNFEIGLIAFDSTLWLAILIASLIHPLFLAKLLIESTGLMLFLALIILLLEKEAWAIKYLILFPIFQYINLASYIVSFFRAVGSKNRILSWQKVARYAAPTEAVAKVI